MASSESYKIFGAGNPLLDCSLEFPDDAVFAKYGIQPASACLAEEKHKPLFAEICANENVQYIPGGATLNTIRVSKWVMGENGKAAYLGSVGKDSVADTLESGCQNDGVTTALHRSEECTATGRCAVVVVGKERSLVADLQAANHYPVSSLDTPEAQALWTNSDICYSAGFWLTVCPEGMVKIAKHCRENNKTFCLNISAPFLAQFFLEPMKEVLKYTDILFGNEDECAALAKTLSFMDPSADVENAKQFSKFNLENEGTSPRTVVITRGLEPVIVAQGDNARLYTVPQVAKESIVDLNGAGDSFVGGFLAALAQGKDEATRVAYGNYAAGQIIQVAGTDTSNLTRNLPTQGATLKTEEN